MFCIIAETLTNRGREKRENGGRNHENAPKMAHNRKRERHKKGTLGKKKRETDRKVEKRATKRKKNLSYAELGASCL